MRKLHRTNFDAEMPVKGICNVAAAIVGSAVVGAAVSSSASRSAARTQAGAAQDASQAQLQAARESNALQWQMYQQNLANQSPYLTGGQSAYAALMGGMGLNAPRVAGQAPQPVAGNDGRMTIQPVDTSTPEGRMTIQGMPSGEPTFTNAEGVVVDAQGNPVEQSPYGGIQNYGASQSEMDAAAGQYQDRFTQQFNGANFEQDPSYQFRLNEGMRALQSSAAARGTLMTGQGLKDITNYSQGAASQEYQAAFDRYRTQQSDLYNRLASLAGVGQTATGAIGAAGTAAAGNIGATTVGAANASSNYLTQGAAANAAGRVGSANAWSGAANNAMNNWMGYQYLNRGASGGAGGGYWNGTDFTGTTPG